MSETKSLRIIRPQEGGQDLFVRSSADVVFFGGSLGGGKAQPVETKIVTPFGLRKMGELKVGDIISRRNGQFQKVIGVYEQGQREIIELLFADGRKSECCEEHLWNVRRAHTRNKRFGKSGNYGDLWEVMTTSQIINYLDTHKGRIYIPNCGDIAFTKSGRGKQEIHPYLLGALIGDGSITSSKSKPTLACVDMEIVEHIRALGYTVTHIGSEKSISYSIKDDIVLNALKKYGLYGHRAEGKFIPPIYLYGSIENRQALLQGLFDTDGTINIRGHMEYDTVSEQLAKDIQWLVWSFGGICTMKTKIGSYRLLNGEKKVCQKVYRLYIRLRDAKRFFHLSRKKARVIDHIQIGNDNFETAIVGYRRTGIKTQMRCIKVSSPDSLYVTNDFIVTHNTAGAILASAEPAKDPLYRAVYFRRTLGELKGAGGVVDEFENLYGDAVTVTKSENPRITFKESGAWLECRQIADENPNKVRETYKGLQADAIFFEELTGFAFYTFNYLMSRARGKAKWTGKVRATTNPSKRHWVRKWCDWYIGPDGQAIEERSGIVRYFYLDGSTVDDLVWGDSKEEVYRKCKKSIDRKLASLKGTSTYENLIKSFTFIKGNLAENKELLKNNPDYVGNVSGSEGDALLMGSWNYDPEEENEAPIIASKARAITENDPCMNGDMWITADLADVGKDNTIVLVWNGFHIIDYKIVQKTTGRGNYEAIKRMQLKHGVGDSHVIYDGQRAMYMPDYIPDAIPYISGYAPRGLYRLNFQRLKDECYMRLVNAINEGYISMSEDVANDTYQHQNIKVPITILAEFVDECSVVRFKEVMGGKKALLGKTEMNSQLGHDGSMDWLDAMHMRFLPCLACEYGQEIEYGVQKYEDNDYDDSSETIDIYDESAWC